MKLRDIQKQEFDQWFLESCRRHADDRAYINKTAPEKEMIEVNKMTESMLPDGMDTKNHYFYVLDDGAVENIGFIWFGTLPEINKDEIILLDIMIGESHRQKGYGRKILELGQKKMKELGYKKVLLNVMERNFAKHLYESMGYVTIKQMDDHKIMIITL